MIEQGDPGPAVEAVSGVELEQKRLARERALRALELRKAGWSYSRIQSNLKFKSVGGVQKALKHALKWTLSDSTEEIRALEIERLDVLLTKCTQILALVNTQTVTETDEHGAVKPKANPYYQDFELLFKAIDRLLLINIRRSKLLGLEVPPQTALLMAEYQKLFDQFSRLVSEVGGIIVKEAPPDVSQRILEKIASFQAASAGAMAGTVSVAGAVANGQLSEMALNLTQVNIAPPAEPRVRAPGPAVETLPIPEGFEPKLGRASPGESVALQNERDELRDDPEGIDADEPE